MPKVVEQNLDWQIVSYPKWVEIIYPQDLAGNGTVVIKFKIIAPRNDETDTERTGDIVIYCKDCGENNNYRKIQVSRKASQGCVYKLDSNGEEIENIVYNPNSNGQPGARIEKTVSECKSGIRLDIPYIITKMRKCPNELGDMPNDWEKEIIEQGVSAVTKSFGVNKTNVERIVMNNAAAQVKQSAGPCDNNVCDCISSAYFNSNIPLDNSFDQNGSKKDVVIDVYAGTCIKWDYTLNGDTNYCQLTSTQNNDEISYIIRALPNDTDTEKKFSITLYASIIDENGNYSRCAESDTTKTFTFKIEAKKEEPPEPGIESCDKIFIEGNTTVTGKPGDTISVTIRKNPELGEDETVSVTIKSVGDYFDVIDTDPFDDNTIKIKIKDTIGGESCQNKSDGYIDISVDDIDCGEKLRIYVEAKNKCYTIKTSDGSTEMDYSGGLVTFIAEEVDC